jgi:hypothetical protein
MEGLVLLFSLVTCLAYAREVEPIVVLRVYLTFR